MAALFHPFSEVKQVERRVIFNEPVKIVPVAPFNAIFPRPAQERVHFTREKGRRRIQHNAEGNRFQRETRLDLETGRGVVIDLKFFFFNGRLAAKVLADFRGKPAFIAMDQRIRLYTSLFIQYVGTLSTYWNMSSALQETKDRCPDEMGIPGANPVKNTSYT